MRTLPPGLALALAFTATPDFAAEAPYTTYSADPSFVVDLPVGTQVSVQGFTTVHDGVPTRFTIESSAPHVDDREVRCAGGRTSYMVNKPNLFAYTCLHAGRITYYIAKYGRVSRMGASNSTELIEFRITYPAAQRAFWDPAVTHMSRSLRFIQ